MPVNPPVRLSIDKFIRDVGKRGNVPGVLTPEERGPLSAWLYEARLLIDLSPEQVVQRLGKYDAGTIRKADSHSENVSRPLWRALSTLYLEVAREKRKVLPPAPLMAGASTAPQSEVPAALYDRIDSLVAELQADRLAWAEDRRLIRDLLDLLVRPPDDPVEQAVTAAKGEVLVAEEAAARELERTRLTPPRSGPRNPDGARRRTSREGETA